MHDRYVVYDIETTGLHPSLDAITQISAIRVVDGVKENDIFNVFVLTDTPIPEEVTRLTGIDSAVLHRYGVSINEAMDKFRAYVGVDLLVAHNGKRFDSKFIEVAGDFTGVHIRNPQQDSMILAKSLIPGLRSYSLASLVDYFNVRKRNAHRAQNDVLMLVDVYEQLLNIQSEKSQMMLF